MYCAVSDVAFSECQMAGPSKPHRGEPAKTGAGSANLRAEVAPGSLTVDFRS
jgi:hypothetical protein